MMFRPQYLAAALLFALNLTATAATTATLATSTVTLNIVSQPLGDALNEFGRQAGLQVVLFSVVGEGITSPRLVGSYEARTALTQLLANTALVYEFINERTVAIRLKNDSSISAAQSSPMQTGSSENTDIPLHLAHAEISPPTVPAAEEKQSAQNSDGKSEEKSEIVVTGTHIRGARNEAAPLIIMDREYIRRSGAQTVTQLMRSLPQNFGGGQSETNSESATGNAGVNGGNVGKGTSINLRGLGSEATLVLVNGHRLAPSGAQDSVDVSSIPLSAVERVETLLDGASAVYGADAVGGVVNFILKKVYDGADTSLSFGSSPDGGSQKTGAQSFGTAWSSGNALLSYEYSKQNAINTDQRSYSNAVTPPMMLVPESERNTIFLSADQSIGSRYSAFFQGLGTRRSLNSVTTFPGTSYIRNQSTLHQYSLVTGLSAKWNENWQSSLSLSQAKDSLDYFALSTQLPGGAVVSTSTPYTSRVGEIEVGVTGALFEIPAGKVRIALGGGAREAKSELTSDVQSPDRRVKDVYMEAEIPLVGDANNAAFLHSLNLNLEGRYEDYNDFGRAFSPKAGLAYSPLAGLILRGTWARAFRAPKPASLYAPRQANLLNVTSGAPGAPFIELLRTGGNAKLGPERSNSYTLGLDIEPRSIENLRVSATYFNIDYKDRILTATGSVITAPTNPAYSSLITVNPTLADVQSILQNSDIVTNGIGNAPLSDVRYIVDFRYNNISSVKTSGVDLLIDWTQEIGAGSVDLILNATKRIKLDLQTLPAGPVVPQLDLIFQPPSLRARAGSTVSYSGWSTSAFANYVHGSLNNGVVPNADIASWTTVDAQIAYAFAAGKYNLLENIRVALSASNVLNKDPPYARRTVAIGYDTTNADPRGRFLSFSIEKHW